MEYNPLTEGKISREIIKFAFPFFLACLLQGLYGAIDLYFIGQYTSSAVISAVSIGSHLMHSVTALLIGISTGATVLIGNRVGAKDKEGTATAIVTAYILFAIEALLITPVILTFSDKIIHLMQTPQEAVLSTRDYVKCCSYGIPFIIGYNTVSAIFRGLGDSKRPLYFIILACIVNIIADYFFIARLGWGAFGAALATVISQALSFICAAIFLCHYKGNFSFKITRKNYKFHPKSYLAILKVGIPLSAQDSFIHFSFLIIHAIINSLGVVASASVGVVEKIMIFGMFTPVSFASAVATMTAQNMGAGKEKRALHSLYYGIGYSVLIGILTFSCAQLYPQKLISIFTHDQDILVNAAQYMRSFSYEFILVCFVFCANAYFSGRGNSILPLCHSLLATFGVRIPVSYYLSLQPDVTLAQLGYAPPLASLLSAFICVAYLYYLSLKRKRQQIKLS